MLKLRHLLNDNPFNSISTARLIDERLPLPINPSYYEQELITQPKLLKSSSDFDYDGSLISSFSYEWEINDLALPVKAQLNKYCPNKCVTYQKVQLIKYINLP